MVEDVAQQRLGHRIVAGGEGRHLPIDAGAQLLHLVACGQALVQQPLHEAARQPPKAPVERLRLRAFHLAEGSGHDLQTVRGPPEPAEHSALVGGALELYQGGERLPGDGLSV